MGPLRVEPEEGAFGAACACCAGEAGVRGFVYEDEVARAVYFVEPLGVANYPLIKLGVAVGEWSAGSPTSSRLCFALLCKATPQGPDLAASEAKMLAFPELAMLGRRLTSAELAQHRDLDDFRRIATAIIDQDWRLETIRGGRGAPRRFSADPV